MFFRRRAYPPTLFGRLWHLIVLAWVFVGIFAVIGYAAGWIVIRHDAAAHKETIEIKTDQIKDAAKKAVEEGKEVIQKIRGKTEQPGQQPPAPPVAQPPAPQNQSGAAPAERPSPDASGKTPPPPPLGPNGGE